MKISFYYEKISNKKYTRNFWNYLQAFLKESRLCEQFAILKINITPQKICI